jgi:hypothetical protein
MPEISPARLMSDLRTLATFDAFVRELARFNERAGGAS